MNDPENGDNSIILPPITRSSKRTSKNNSFINSGSNKEDNRGNALTPFDKKLHPEDYAEAFNQLSNAKFLLMSKIDKLKYHKKNQIYNNDSKPNIYNDEENYENFNQVYNHLDFNNERNLYNKPYKNENNESSHNKYNKGLTNQIFDNRYRNYNNPFNNFHNPIIDPSNNYINSYNPVQFPYFNEHFYPTYPYGDMPPYGYPKPNYYGNVHNENVDYYYNKQQKKVIFPKILMGMPLNPDQSSQNVKRKNKKNISNHDILNALKDLLNKNTQDKEKDEDEDIEDSGSTMEEETIKEKQNSGKGKDLNSNKKKNQTVLENNKKITKIKLNTGKWWNLIRDLTHLTIFFNTCKKYSQAILTRNKEIVEMESVYPKYLDVIKKWLFQIELPLWNELKKSDLNLSFNSSTSKNKYQENCNKIMNFINIFIKNLLSKSVKNVDIPEVILQIIYKFIKINATYPKSFLTSYEINKLDFDVIGGVKNFTNENVLAMILSFLIISKVGIQQIMLKPLQNIDQVKTFKNIDISMKFICSILFFILQETFQINPSILKDKLCLFNYFRSYKLSNAEIEKEKQNFVGAFSNNFNLNNIFQLNDNSSLNGQLLDPGLYKEFIQTNKTWIEAIKKYISQWSIGLVRYIKLKYENK